MSKDVDKNLDNEIEFIIKRNESSVEHNMIEQLLFKYKRRNDIHELKTVKPMNHKNQD